MEQPIINAAVTGGILFPFRVRSTLPHVTFADDLYAVEMDDAAKETLLRIADPEYDEAGRLKKFTALPGCLLGTTFGPSLDTDDEFCASNYVLHAPSRQRALEFNFSLKLADESSSSLYIGYEHAGATHFIHPPCYFGKDPLALTEETVALISGTLANISRSNDDRKLSLIKEKYLYAMSEQVRREGRFVEIAIILEMLLLPQSSTELSYRFSLRLAKLASRLFSLDVQDVYRDAKRIYITRSNLVHSGSDSDIDRVSEIAINYTRRLLLQYLEDKDMFTETSLDALCLS